jgi:hypothetical protein
MTQWTSRPTHIHNKNNAIRAAAIKNGYASGFENVIADFLKAEGVTYEYEANRLNYIVPQRKAFYTPDFYITTRTGKTIVIETKGRFLTANRQTMILIKSTYPDLDIRFVFSSSKAKISTTSDTTYAMWCDKHGFPHSHKVIPKEWLNE